MFSDSHGNLKIEHSVDVFVVLFCLDAGGGFEPQFVTELPPESFKKPKLNKYFDASGSADTDKGGVYELRNRRPVFSKRNSNKHVVSPEGI